MNQSELQKLSLYLNRVFKTEGLAVKARPKKDDSAEVYMGDEFIGVIYKDDEEDDELSYNFSMAILDYDLGG